jgi:hypothetical protein
VSGRPVAGRLAVVDDGDRVLVVIEDDPSDWLCAFEKAHDFPADRWAQDMARTYNARVEPVKEQAVRPRRPSRG